MRLDRRSAATLMSCCLWPATMVWTTPSQAASNTSGLPGSPSGASAQSPLTDKATLLRRIQEATRLRSFVGTYVVSTGAHLTSARISHYCDGHDQIERIESLDGQMRVVFRHNDAVHVFWPGSKTALIEQRELVGSFPAPVQAGDIARLDMYDLQQDSEDRVAGLEAQVVTLKPRDKLRFARRLWLERRTGLLLRTDLVNERGDTVESSAFSELQLGSKLQPQAMLQDMNRLDGYKVNRPVYEPSDLGSEGWSLRQPIAGFEVQRVVRRPMPHASNASNASLKPAAHDSGISTAAPTQAQEPNSSMIQAVYTDGLAHVSVFIESYVPQLHRRETPASVGSMNALSRRQGDWWITAVGAVPTATLQLFATSLERRKP